MDLARTRRHLARVLRQSLVWLARRSLAAISCIARLGRRTPLRRVGSGIIIVIIATLCREGLESLVSPLRRFVFARELADVLCAMLGRRLACGP